MKQSFLQCWSRPRSVFIDQLQFAGHWNLKLICRMWQVFCLVYILQYARHSYSLRVVLWLTGRLVMSCNQILSPSHDLCYTCHPAEVSETPAKLRLQWWACKCGCKRNFEQLNIEKLYWTITGFLQNDLFESWEA